MPIRKPKQIIEYQIMHPSEPVVLAMPITKSLDDAVRALDEHKKILADHEHTTVKIDKVVKVRALKEKLVGDKTHKEYGYDVIARQSVAICHLTDKGFKCHEYNEENTI